MPSLSLVRYLTSAPCRRLLPRWVSGLSLSHSFPTDASRMRLAIELSRRNTLHRSGGPFGAALFDLDTGRLLGIGMNRVVPLNDPGAHAEMVALRVAGGFLNSFSLREAGLRAALYSSAQPCGMCQTGVLWGGVRHLFFGALRADVERIGFDEGVRTVGWTKQLRRRGVEVQAGFLRREAVSVLRLYERRGGEVYNG